MLLHRGIIKKGIDAKNSYIKILKTSHEQSKEKKLSIDYC